MAYRTRDFTGEILTGLSGIGQIGTAITDKRKADLLAKEGSLRIKELEQKQLLDQQQIDKNKKSLDDSAQADQISADTEARGLMTTAALEGTATADGHAVNMDEIKAAKQADSDAKLWNLTNKGKEGFLPLNGRALMRSKEDKALTANRADQESIKKDERDTESHVSKMATEKAARENGHYLGTALGDNRLGVINTRTGDVTDTGEKSAPKGGANKQIAVSGDTLIPNLEPIPNVEITNDSLKKTKDAYAAYQAFKNQLDTYKTVISTQGAELVGEKADKADAMLTDLGMKLKALQELGVLNGKDWELMMKQVPSSTGLGASIKGKLYNAAGQDAFGPRLDVLSNSMDDKFKVFAETNGFRKAAKPAPAAPASSSKFKILSVD